MKGKLCTQNRTISIVIMRGILYTLVSYSLHANLYSRVSTPHSTKLCNLV